MNKTTFIACITVFLISGCNNSEQLPEGYISASACATKSTSGEISDCEINDETDQRLTESLNFFRELDNSHPGPEGPDVLNLEDEELFKVIRIDDEFTIYVNNGSKLRLAGLECRDPYLKKYLRAMFIGKSGQKKIFYTASGDNVEDVDLAYIWEVRIYDNGMNSVAPTNEAAITSQWCNPVPQNQHMYHERYKRIAAFAKENAL